MRATYSLPSRKARICRIAGALFLLFALGSALEPVVMSIWPAPAFGCHPECRWQTRPVAMLEEDEQAKIVATPGADRTFAAYMDRALIRLGIFGASAVESAPLAVLLLGVGLALRRLGGAGTNPVGEALPWLRRASLAAMLWAITQPLSNSLMATILSPGTPSGAHLYLLVDFVTVGTALMFATAAYATVWALESGLKAQRDLDKFV